MKKFTKEQFDKMHGISGDGLTVKTKLLALQVNEGTFFTGKQRGYVYVMAKKLGYTIESKLLPSGKRAAVLRTA